MPVEVIMPKVDMDMATGTIAKWHVAEGAAVTKGEPLFDIETDKAAMEVDAPGDGTLHHVIAAEGATIPIGAPVAWIYAKGEEIGPPPERPAPAEPSIREPQSTDAPEQMAATISTAAPGAKSRATPAARRAARLAGTPLDLLAGSGPRGRIQARDVPQRPLSTPDLAAPAPLPAQSGALAVYRSGPATGEPLVLIHGFAADATSFAQIEPMLARMRPVIRIDLPGHGKSPRRVPQDFPALAAELRAAFDALDTGPVHLVGHSLGGALALALADTRSRKVARLTLLSPAGLGPEVNGAAIAGLARASRAESLGPWVRLLTADPAAISADFVRAAASFRADPALRAAQVAMAERLFPDGVQSFDLIAALHRLACPARIVFGRQDNVIPYRHALRAPGRVALHLYDRVGHLPQFEIAEEIASLLLMES